MKLFCFRFDIDTHLCSRKGVPNLLGLADDLNVKFTFFFNMGRGLSRRSYFLRNKKNATPIGAKLSHIGKLGKLGKLGYIKTVLFNPFVGYSCPEIIRMAKKQGHEIGLHGGRNHGDWMYNAGNWCKERFQKEIRWGVKTLQKVGIEEVTSFASPGWKNSKVLFPILAEEGFNIVADWHGTASENITQIDKCGRLLAVTTNLTGEPGGIGYIENKRAQGLNNEDILKIFKEDLTNINRLGVLYDHAYFVGNKELSLIEKMVKTVIEMNFKIITLNSIPEYIKIP